ncbi:MAG TPA: homoserine dehydrogenase [Anaerolineae bacterium]
MKRVPLLIMGAGKVGRALVRQLLEAAAIHEERDGLRPVVVAWCDRTGAVVDTDGLGPETLRATETAKAAGTPLAETPAGYHQDDLAAIVDVAGTDGCIVVDVTAGDETIPALELALRRGYAAVTANKVPLTAAQSTFERLVGSGRFRYESTVGSAVPVIEALRGLLRANDRIDAIEGALSGTLGFICTGLEAGRPFSALVAEAHERGYTEPDPRVDLGGMDVARKGLILARTMGWRLEQADVAVSSLVPPELTGLPVGEFMARLPQLDADFSTRAAAAAVEGKVLRYLAQLRDGRVTVGLQPVSRDTALGRLRGNDNLVAFHTRYYPDEPLVLQGRGAGVDAAAAGAHADLVALAQGALTR